MRVNLVRLFRQAEPPVQTRDSHAPALPDALDQVDAAGEDQTDQIEPLFEQLEEDVRLTMRIIGYDADNVRSKAEESVAIVERIRDASSNLTELAAIARDVTIGLADTSEKLEHTSQAIKGDISGTDHFIHEANALADDVTGRMAQLSTAVDRIATVVAVIGTIARQTNLLALNASIEAARAGAAGRGFAVVATEVKSLAHEVQSATGDVASQIAMLQDVARASGDAVGRIATLIRRVDPVLGSIRSTLDSRVDGIRDVAERAALSLTFVGEVSEKAEAMTGLTEQAMVASRGAGDTTVNMEVSLRRLTQRSMAALRNAHVGNRRRNQRVPISIEGRLDIGNRSVPVRAVDLSTGGTLLKVDIDDIALGDKGQLHLDHIGSLPVTVLAISEDGKHVRFDGADMETAERIEETIRKVHVDNKPLIELVQGCAGEISQAFCSGIIHGRIKLDDLITMDYRRIEGTDPVQYKTNALGFYEDVLPPILAHFRSQCPECQFFVACDLNSYIPVHHPEYSLAQKPGDAEWNDLHSRNRRIMNRSKMIVSARNRNPYVITAFQRHLNDGSFVATKLIAAPIFVNNQLWGSAHFAVVL